MPERSGLCAAGGTVHREPCGEAGMQSSEQVVTRILDLDQRAEEIRAAARGEAETISRDTAKRLAAEKERLDKRIAARIAEIEADAAKARAREIDGVNADYDGQVNAVNGISPEKRAGVADMVVSRIRESAL